MPLFYIYFGTHYIAVHFPLPCRIIVSNSFHFPSIFLGYFLDHFWQTSLHTFLFLQLSHIKAFSQPITPSFLKIFFHPHIHKINCSTIVRVLQKAFGKHVVVAKHEKTAHKRYKCFKDCPE